MTPKGAKPKGLIALLGEVPKRRRGRRWLESRLWSDRAPKQASASLRQALNEIRTAFGEHRDLLGADRFDVWLEADTIETDIDEGAAAPEAGREILEGLDVRDPEFEDWLAALRQKHEPEDQAEERPQRVAGFRLICKPPERATGMSGFIGRILSEQIGKNIEERIAAWRINERIAEVDIEAAGELHISCEVQQEGGTSVALIRVTHAQTGRLLYSGVRQVSGGCDNFLSTELISELAHDAAGQSVLKLPHAADLDRPEVIATGFANAALRRLASFDARQIADADGLLERAFRADRSGVYLAWRGFTRMAQSVDQLTPGDAAWLEEADALTRQALELSPSNAQVLALVGLTRMMLFDEIDVGGQLAHVAMKFNENNLFARQVSALAKSGTGDAQAAFELSRSCQKAVARDDFRHLWDLYHCLVCIAAGRLEEAVEAGRRASVRAPNFLAPRRQLLALFANTDKPGDAALQARALRRLESGFTLDRFLRDSDYPVRTLRKSQLLGFSEDEIGDF